MSEKRKPGRPPLGNVLFARRVPPSKVPELLQVLARDREVAGFVEKEVDDKKGSDQLKKVAALLDDIEGLTKEVDYWKARFQKAVDAYEGDQVAYWRAMAKGFEKRLRELEGDGSG